jgi:hypothetical protein
MLKISNFKKGDVMTVKCSTGEEVVARFDSEDDNALNVVKPTVLTINPQDGKAMLIPWIMSIDTKSNDPVFIGKAQVVAITKTEKNLADGYMQSTTGITTATAAESSLLI